MSNPAANGNGSLRRLVTDAVSGDTIIFATNLSGQTITPAGGALVLNKNLTLDASALPGGITISGGNVNRIVEVATNTSVVLSSITLSGGNGAGATANGSGGAIHNLGVLTLTNCTFKNNTSTVLGGAITSTGSGSSVTARRCNFTANNSGGNNGGGAIYGIDATLIDLTDCNFLTNHSPTTAGAIHLLNSATGIVSRCTFAGNSAIDAGAVRNNSGALTLINCTLTGNTATNNGGGLYANGGTTTVRHCTISGNNSPNGGGLRLFSGTLILENTIVAANTASIIGPDLSQTGGVLTRSGINLVGNNTGATAAFPTGAPNINGDFVGTAASPMNALLAPLANYGGFTQTMPPRPGSPAIDAATTSTTTIDQRGFPRPLDGDNNATLVADIGAAEVYFAVNVKFKSHWPSYRTGEANDVVTVDGFAYVATSAGLMIFDLSEPANPVLVGEYNTESTATKVAARNGYVWLATAADQFNSAKVLRIDARNPGAPLRIAQYANPNLAPRDIALVGNYAYVAASNSVLILNENCNLLQTVPVTNSTVQLLSTPGNYACVIGRGWPILVYDVANPADPIPVAAVLDNTPFFSVLWDSALAGDRLYRFGGGAGTFDFHIDDVRDPLNRPEIGALFTNVGQVAYISLFFLAEANGFAYCVSSDITGNGLFVVDVRQPATPTLVSGQSFPNGWIRGMSILGQYAYLAAGSAGLTIFDLSSPTNPVPVGGFSTALRAKAVTLQGNTAYLLDGNNGVHVLDVSDPAFPRRIDSYVARNNCEAFAQAKRWLYLGVGGGYGTNNPVLEILDLANPSALKRVGRVAHPAGGGNDYRPAVTAIGLDRDTAVITVGPNGGPDLSPKTINVSNPVAPTLIGSFSGFGNKVSGIVVRSNQAYFCVQEDFFQGLQITDIPDPAAPVMLGQYQSFGVPDAICLLGDYCYLSSSNGTEILGVGDLNNPSLLSTCSNRISFVQNSRGFGAGDSGFAVFDLSHPTLPVALGQYPGVRGAVTVEGRYAFVADANAGLTILDLGAALATPPSITTQPENARTLTGQTTNFFAGVRGTVPLSFQWRFNGTNIPGATQPLLSLTNLQFANAGQYSLLVSNEAGIAISSNGVLTVDFPAVVQLTSPFNNEVFWPSSTVALTATATDPDAPTGWVTQVEFFNGSISLGIKTNPPPYSNSVFSLTWSNVPAGNYSLKAVATDNEGATNASAPVNIVVTNQPAFQLSQADYRVVESNGLVTVTVKRNLATNSASVTLFTENATAFAAPPGGIGSYYAVTTNLSFPTGVVATNVPITIINDLVNRGDRQFVVRLSNPTSGWQLVEPTNAYVTIMDDDALTNNFADVALPPIGASGALQVSLLPTNALGNWRFWWETDWRDSGTTVSNLLVGEYTLEFMPRSGFVSPAPTTLTISNAAAFLSRTNYYTNLVGVVATGGLKVALLPAGVATAVNLTNRGQWRLAVESTNWNDSGSILANIPEGAHLAEFKSIPGYETPARQVMVVAADQAVTYEATYAATSAPLANGPVPLDSYTTITNDTIQPGTPYRFAGQLFTDAGLSSGFVVKPRTVLTAAHTVFDIGRLSFATNVWWFFQRHRGDYEPLAQQPRGWHVFAGYSAARASDPSPNESTIETRNLDVAALYFFEDAGRGGYGGYLITSTNGEWLDSSRLKLMVGYPVEVVPGINRGKMHQVGPFFAAFQKVTNQVYRSDQIVSYGGNSGGPLCVLSTNSANRAFFIPAGVYLGGSGESIVRAIDLDVVDLINRAENSSHGGTNSTGGGVIPISRAPSSLLSHPGYLSVSIGPPAAVRLGAQWRVSPTNFGELAELRFYTNYTANPLTLAVRSTNFSIQVADLPGFLPPTNRPVVIPENSVEQLQLNYSVLPPWLTYHRSTGLGMTGTVGTAYRIDAASQLAGVPNWASVTNSITLTPGTNWIPGTSPTSGSNRFYRALWLPE